MFRSLLLIIGVALLAVNWYDHPCSDLFQTTFFAAGFILVGVPHGGADQLIAMKTSSQQNRSFTVQKFTTIYCGQIIIFLLFFYCLPHLAILIFLLMAAYHFGETDIRQARYASCLDKFLRLTYGILILGTILLPNFSSIQTTLLNLNSGGPGAIVIHWIGHYNAILLLSVFALHAVTVLVYYSLYSTRFVHDWKAMLQLVALLIILYNLPLLLSFTFYFIIWHSVASLKNMVNYLLENEYYKSGIVIKEITKNSLIVLVGILLVGYFTSLFHKNDDLVLNAMIGLAALTGPHMHVMHGMYQHGRPES